MTMQARELIGMGSNMTSSRSLSFIDFGSGTNLWEVVHFYDDGFFFAGFFWKMGLSSTNNLRHENSFC